MRKSENRQRLESNQQQIQEHLLSLISCREMLTTQGYTNLVEFSVDGLSKLADKYEILRDSTIIRDARRRNAVSDELNGHSTKMLWIAVTRAALLVINSATKEGDDLDEVKKQLETLFNTQLDKATRNKKDLKKQFTEYNKEVLALLETHFGKKIDGLSTKECLQHAYNAANINNKQGHISTISNVNGHTVVETDVMALGLTNTQLDEFRNISVSNADNINWYANAPSIAQKMIQYVVRHTLDRNNNPISMLPTQLRNLIPGAKNAYVKFTYVLEGQKLTCVSENLHSGAVFFGSKFASKQDVAAETKEMAEQLHSFAPNENSPLLQVNFTSPWNLLNKDENAMNVQAQAAMQASRNLHANTPMNLLRVGPRDVTGYTAFLEAFCYMIQERDINKTVETHYTEARRLLSTSFFSATKHDNLVLLGHMSALNTAVHVSRIFGDAGNEIPYLGFNCASGKDRAGTAAFYTSVIALSEKLAQNPDDIAPILNANGHTQLIPSINNLGTHGVKSDSREVIQQLLPRIDLTRCHSDFNKLKFEEGWLTWKSMLLVGSAIGLAFAYYRAGSVSAMIEGLGKTTDFAKEHFQSQVIDRASSFMDSKAI
jgi:hypothetical protein